MEAVLPIEVQIPSLRVLMDVKLQEAEWVRTRYEELSLIEEKRLAAICHGQLYQQRMKRAFDKKASWIIPGGDRSEASYSEGRKHGESEDIWGVTELELDEIVGFTWSLG
ncbi:hypothetical protein KIW84_032525 [Lathyrus oleraceus]|uniref:Uncharacterized protein n=1 Tax=Pisum sativum TaxID=3888 RepID=A0A9D4XXR6_PEA|nr:hypothetical protein KIW84_032525 [Pisum sativum]